MSISREQFARLKAGDIVFVNGQPRTILTGPGDRLEPPKRKTGRGSSTGSGPAMSVTFAIRRRSWTNRAETTQSWNDLKHKMTLPRKGTCDPKLVCNLELSKLADIGFDALRELEREIANYVRLERLWGGRHTANPLRVAMMKLKRLKRRAHLR